MFNSYVTNYHRETPMITNQSWSFSMAQLSNAENRHFILIKSRCPRSFPEYTTYWIIKKNIIIPARDPKQRGGTTGYETSGGDDHDNDDTQMRAQRGRHMRAHICKHTYKSTHMRADICKHTYKSTHIRAHI